MTPASSIHAQGLCKSFHGRPALREVDLHVDEGEIVALLGRNGAGKSTLLRILSTTVIADSGEAYVGGFDVRRESASVRGSVGVVLGDERSWYWRLSGRGNLEFFGAMYGLRRAAARRRAGELLELVDLGERGDQRFDGYSAGMRARLSLARGLLRDPPVLLLDEPTRTLDPIASLRFRRMLRAVADQQRAILWVTHDLHEAADIADRALLISDGHIVDERADPGNARELEEMVVAGGAA